ncbi:HAD-IA family hydrolase [Sphingomonas sp. LHG3406-1]|uniref:HAD-IA family hydrolase n=1 Tax=Sphingomonas sp. LHG3406-1 TaxID=2804617 RepID=UPI002605782E|nr:HAD-IA family hydrolase [Sphingomonas sp. LHG3406-1]
MIRCAIFDCDGTLVDSGGTIHRALGLAFTEHRLELPPRERAQRVIGLSLTEAMAALAPEQDSDTHQRMAQTYKDAFVTLRGRQEVEEPLYDGILPLLDDLESRGWTLAVATGKSDRGLRHCLTSHGIHARFVSLQTADRHPSKPHPSMTLTAMAECGAAPERSVVIGDTAWDMGMAKAAGAHAIGALWGYHDHAELSAAGADAIAEAPAVVLEIAEQLVRATA